MPEPQSAEAVNASGELLDRRRSLLLAVDLQEKLLNLLPEAVRVQRNVERLLRGAEAVGVPALATEQYPERLGGAPEALREALPTPDGKRAFSCWQAPEIAARFSSDRDQIVVCGIETHVCVMQTTADLLAQGFRVFVVADAVGARRSLDHELGLRRAESLGAVLVTTEMVLFEWCGTSLDPQFKLISQLVKDG